MDVRLAYDLIQILMDKCPVDTGQLRGSIQPIHMTTKHTVVMIGNATANLRSVPSNVYAAFTNNAKTLSSGRANRNYHWVNRAIEQWARKNAIQMSYDMEEEEEE